MPPRPIVLKLPATSANLGPAFDAAALALDLYLTIKARAASRFAIAARGRDPDVCGSLQNNLILDTYASILKSENRPAPALSLTIHNQIPIGRGCGSSAAARIAGILLAAHFGRLRWKPDDVLREAALRESHPDNAAACWLGGLAIARMAETASATAGGARARVDAVKIVPKVRWPLLLVVPSETYSTEAARRVLPRQYSRADAVTNLQNALLLVTAITQGDALLLRQGLADRLHEPYRRAVCPLLPCLQPLAGRAGILGAVLSGAGPSVLILQDPRVALKTTIARVKGALAQCGLSAEVLRASIALQGASANWSKV